MHSAITITRVVALVFSFVVAVAGANVLLDEHVTNWFVASCAVWMALLLAFGVSLFRTGLFGVIGGLFATIVVGRLFSTVHLNPPEAGSGAGADPLLLAETGPGVAHLSYLTLALGVVLIFLLALLVFRGHRADSSSPGHEGWSLAFIRVYVGLMFIPHFAAHIFAGPMPFDIFWSYFASLGFPEPKAMVVLAGSVELAAAIGLAFGFLTRLSAAVGAVYLYLTMLLGNHFPVGYIWILPTGGYEFGIFWAVMVGVFMLVGGGAASMDAYLRARYPALPGWLVALMR